MRQLPTQKQSKELAATHGLRVDRHGVFRIRITEMDAAMKVHTHDRLHRGFRKAPRPWLLLAPAVLIRATG